MQRFADTIDCANPVNWSCPLNRGLIGDYSYVPGLYYRSQLANSAGDSGLIYDLSKLPSGLGREMNSVPSGVMYGIHAGIIGGAWRGPNRPGGFGKTWDNTGGICSWTLGQSDASNVQGRVSKYVFGMTVPFSGFAWINLNGIVATQGVMANCFGGAGGSVSTGWQFVVTDRLRLRFFNGVTGFERSGVDSAASLTAGKWYHVGFTYDGSNTVAGITFYVNAVKRTTNSFADTGDPSPLAGTRPFIWTGDTGTTMVGYGDQARIYNRCLSSMEVRQLYVESLLGSPNLYNHIRDVVVMQEVLTLKAAYGLSSAKAGSYLTSAQVAIGSGRSSVAAESRSKLTVPAASTQAISEAADRAKISPAATKSGFGTSETAERSGSKSGDVSISRGLSETADRASAVRFNLALTVGLDRVADSVRGQLTGTVQIARGISEAADRSSGRDMALAETFGKERSAAWDKSSKVSLARPQVLERSLAESVAHETMIAGGHGESIVPADDVARSRLLASTMAKEFSVAEDGGAERSLPLAVGRSQVVAWDKVKPINTGYLRGLSEAVDRATGREIALAAARAESLAAAWSLRTTVAPNAPLWTPAFLGAQVIEGFRASTLAQTNGQTVQTCPDASGNGHDLAQPTAIWRPHVATTCSASFNGAVFSHLSRPSNASLQTGNIDWWCGLWMRSTDVTSPFPVILSKSNSGWGGGDWHLVEAGGLVFFRVLAAGGLVVAAPNVAANGGVWNDGNWHFIFLWVDSVSQTVNGRFDNFAAVSANWANTPATGTNDFTLGDMASHDEPFTGQLDAVAFGKSPPGGIAAAAGAIRDTLWNGGTGIDLTTVSAANKTAWGGISAWPLNEGSGQQRNDVWGTNHLTDTNRVLVDSGKVEDYFQNGLKCLRFDQRDSSGQGNAITNALNVNQPFDIYMACRMNGIDSSQRQIITGGMQWGTGVGGAPYMYAGNAVISAADALDVWRVHSTRWDAANSYWRRDGGTPDTANIGTFAMNGMDVGHNLGTADIEEIWVTTPLSTSDRQFMEGYLAWLIGTQGNLAAGHPYKNTPPLFTGSAPSILAMPRVLERSAAYDRAKEQVTVAAMHGSSFTVIVDRLFKPQLSISATAIVKIGPAAECRVSIGPAARAETMISAGGQHRARIN